MSFQLDSDDGRLRNLIEMLEDARQFYLHAIQTASDDHRRLYQEKAACYAAMLAEIDEWKSRGERAASSHDAAQHAARPAVAPRSNGSNGSAGAETGDALAELMERISHVHRSMEPARVQREKPVARPAVAGPAQKKDSADQEGPRRINRMGD